MAAATAAADRRGLGGKVLELSELMCGGLDIFSRPTVDTSITSGKTVIHHLNTAINPNTTVFEFVIPSENHEYIHLPMTRLEGEIQVLKNDGTDIVAADNVSLANQLATTLWKQVECEVNGVQVADLTSPTYHYKAFLEHELTYCTDVKETASRCLLYYPDNVAGDENLATGTGLIERKTWITVKNGNLVFSTPLFIDFFSSVKYLIPGAVIKLRFIRNDNSMCFIAPENNYKVVVKSLTLATRKLTIHPQIVEEHRRGLQTMPAYYELTQSKIKTYGIAQGLSSTTLSGIFMGKLPRSCLIGFVQSEAFNGAIATSPFRFRHFEVNYVGLTVNGIPTPSTAFQPDFTGNRCIREYRNFLDHVGVGTDNLGFNVNYMKWMHQTALFAFDFSPDLCNNFHDHPDNSGYVSLDLRFVNPLPTNVTVIIYATYNEALLIDKDGNVTLQQ